MNSSNIIKKYSSDNFFINDITRESYKINDLKSENNGFNRLEEEEKYQKRVKSRHKRLKTANLGHSVGIETPESDPYNEDPELKRSKSAPPGFGGS